MKNETFEDAIPRPNGIYFKLHLAKQEIGKINKSADNPFFKSKYADLNTILDVVEPILHKYNLLLLQPIMNGCVHSVIVDIETGEDINAEIKLPELNDPQKLEVVFRILDVTHFNRCYLYLCKMMMPTMLLNTLIRNLQCHKKDLKKH